jgi:hypothetical protein
MMPAMASVKTGSRAQCHTAADGSDTGDQTRDWLQGTRSKLVRSIFATRCPRKRIKPNAVTATFGTLASSSEADTEMDCEDPRLVYVVRLVLV